MNSKPSRKGRIQRLFTSRSKRLTFNFPPDNPDRYYDFKDTPVNWRPRSPLIDRQMIPHELESQIRTACALLFYSIENSDRLRLESSSLQIPKSFSEDAVPNGSAGNKENDSRVICTRTLASADQEGCAEGVSDVSREVRLSKEFGVIPKIHEVELSGRPVDVRVEQELEGGPDRRDVDGERSKLERSQPAADNIQPDAVLCSRSHRASVVQPLSSPRGLHELETATHIEGETRSIDEDVPQMTPGLGVMASPTDFASPPTPCHPCDSASEDNVEVYLGPDSSGLPCRTPSFSRPMKNPRLTRKERRGGLRSSGNLRNSVLLMGLPDHPSSEDDAPSPDFPPVASQQDSTTKSRARDTRSAIIDPKGLVHFMTAEEELERKLDLQRAVMEKMRVGVIGATPNPSISTEEVQRQVETERLAVEKRNSQPPKPLEIQISLCDERDDCHLSTSTSGLEEHGHGRAPPHSLLPPTFDDPSPYPRVSRKSLLLRKLSVLALGKKVVAPLN